MITNGIPAVAGLAPGRWLIAAPPSTLGIISRKSCNKQGARYTSVNTATRTRRQVGFSGQNPFYSESGLIWDYLDKAVRGVDGPANGRLR